MPRRTPNGKTALCNNSLSGLRPLKIPLLVSRIDDAIFPVTSRKVSIIVSGAIVALLSLLLFSVRQNILTYDNTLETLYFILTVVIAWGIGSWFLLGYVKRATTTAGTRRGIFISILHLAMVVTQFSLLVVMLFVIFDRSSEYVMPYVNGITSGFAILIMGGVCVQDPKVVQKEQPQINNPALFFHGYVNCNTDCIGPCSQVLDNL